MKTSLVLVTLALVAGVAMARLSAEERVSRLQVQLDHNGLPLDGLLTEINEVQDDVVAELTAMKKSHTSKLTTCESERDTLTGEESNLKDAVSELEDAISALETSIRGLKEARPAAETAVKNAKQAVVDKVAAVASAKTAYENADAKLEAEIEQRNAIIAFLDMLEKELQESDVYEHFTASLVQLRERVSSESALASMLAEDDSNNVEQLQALIDRMQQTVAGLLKESQDARSKQTAAYNAAEALRQQELTTLRSAVLSKQQALGNLDTQMAAQQTTMNSKNHDLNSKRSLLAVKSKQLVDKKAQCADLVSTHAENLDKQHGHLRDIDRLRKTALKGQKADCYTAAAGRSLTAECKGGEVINAIKFASFGKPTGTCNNHAISAACHAPLSHYRVRSLCAGKPSCTVTADAAFADACEGAALSVEVLCGKPAPPEEKSVCSSAPEHKTVSIACEDGQTVKSITFVSYGLPTGSCGDYKVNPRCGASAAHQTKARSVAEAACVGKSKCTIAASNGIFGDPCHGTFKRMSIEAVCAGSTPAPIVIEDVDSEDEEEDEPVVKCAYAKEHSGVPATISCPDDSVVTDVTFASYGTPSGECGELQNSGCHASSSIAKVKAACMGKNTCSVHANNGVFGDPCGGTVKHLKYQVTCSAQAAVPEGTVCAYSKEHSGKPAVLKCPTGKVVKDISFASYGTSSGDCGHFEASSCHSARTLEKAKAACVGKDSCSLMPTNAIFGDPCRGTVKHLNLQAVCADAPSKPPGTICATAKEGTGSAIITCPANQVIAEIPFASYGTPTGICGDYQKSSCHSQRTASLLGRFIGTRRAVLAASNGQHGDPCPGTVKRVTMQARCVEVKVATAREHSGRPAILQCSAGKVIKKITFASYGTPRAGRPLHHQVSSCHSPTSKPRVHAACIGKNRCHVTAKNSIFGDPCGGVVKTLLFEAECG
eukprot:PLAT5620.1.p2 GENE.PLAT5620.1~~PLAT5620.1.p2  ORF type:complete len:944 (-),score=473.97 PLAT5620.1:101-2932(-)